MSSSIDLIPHLREQSTSVNLATLQKKDSSVSRLLFTAKHVVLYHLTPSTGQVDRQEVEGPLFLVEKRSITVSTSSSFSIESRLPTGSTRSTAQMSAAMEVQDKYLYFQSSAAVVITLWFHEQPDCVNAEAILEASLRASRQAIPRSIPPPFEAALATANSCFPTEVGLCPATSVSRST